MKTIVVKSNVWTLEHTLDPSLFDGDTCAMYREAAVSVLEKQAMKPHCKVGLLLECYEKKNANKIGTHVLFNTYFVLLGARMYEKANELRKKAKLEFGIDLREEATHE